MITKFTPTGAFDINIIFDPSNDNVITDVKIYESN